jgi:hypothetical protein
VSWIQRTVAADVKIVRGIDELNFAPVLNQAE